MMKHTYRKLLGLLLTLTLILALAVPAFAAGTDAGRGLVKYLKYDPSVGGFVEDEASCTEITARTNVLLSGKWYVVHGEITMNGSMFLDGEANLILADGGKLTVTEGILVREDSALNIFAQSEGTGELYVTPGSMGAGIGGASGENAGDVTIHGGKVTAYGGWLGAGIGGADQGDSGNVTINGGIVTAYGGDSGAGIGGGSESYDGTVTINGGTVTAYGGEYGAGIGGGEDSSGTGVTINGGTVTAVAGLSADGIGGGLFGEAGTLTVGDGVEIKGGDNEASQSVLEAPYSRRYQYMTAVGPEPPVYARVSYQKYDLDAEGFVEDQANAIVIDESSTALSAGWYVAEGEITVADRIQIDGEVNLILADGAKLDAEEGIDVSEGNAFTVYGQENGTGELTAKSTHSCAGIGTADDWTTRTPSGPITIHGGNIKAIGGSDSAGIGGGRGRSNGTVTIYGGTVNASSIEMGPGIGCGDSAGGAGSVIIYGGTVNATGCVGSAGIGGARYCGGGDVTIYGGTVNATGSGSSAGIGGGHEGGCGNVTIYDGTVTAISLGDGAGIGGGVASGGGSVAIYGGNVIAIGSGIYDDEYSFARAEGIGHGPYSESSGSLTVGEGVVIMGGMDADSLAVLDSPFNTRWPYMTAIFQEPPATAEADYLEYDLTTKEFDEKTAECLVIDEDSTALSDGWYVVQDEVTIAERIEIDGDVNLILADGAELNAQKGIHVLDPNSLTIYAQTEGSGKLIAMAERHSAGIGMDDASDSVMDPIDGTSGPVTIHGGMIEATGGPSAAGIGGGYFGSGGTVTIYGGTVNASCEDGGAGIGGGYKGVASSVNIYGGTVYATGGPNAAGIGSGAYVNDGDGGSITIYGGNVVAQGGITANGIGSGYQSVGCTVTIYDGEVTATGGYGCAGIGGYRTPATTTIYGGKVTATGGDYAAGIGGNTSYGNGGITTIEGGVVIATAGGYGAAGIGGTTSSGNAGTTVIRGGDVTATGKQYGAGIGGGIGSYGGTVEISGGKVMAIGGQGAAGIGTGIIGELDGVTITGGDVTGVGGANGSRYAEGIGRGASAVKIVPLTVAEGLVVKGGMDADSLEPLDAPYETRPPYMTVKEVPVYSFVWSWDGDEPTVTLKLTWANGDQKTYPTQLGVTVTNDAVVYSVIAEAEGETYFTEKTVARTYTVQVTNGTITAGEKDSYSYGDTINLTANPAPDGQVFAGWYLNDELVSTSKVYGRVVDQDLVLEARYDDAPLPVEPVVTASDTPRTAAGNSVNYKTTLSVNWSVPDRCKLVEAGVIRAFAKSAPSQNTLVTKGTKKATSLKTANGTYKLTISVSGSTNTYNLYYVGYVVYKDASGNILTKYSEIGCNASPIAIS